MRAKKDTMKRAGMFLLIFFICLAAISIPENAKAGSASTNSKFEVDASFLYASPPASDFQGAYGGNFGFGVMLNQAKTLQGRIDFSPLQWKRGYFGNDLFYKRQVVAMSGRYYMSTYSEIIKFFTQLGVEISSDKQEHMDSTWIKTTTSETNTGITPGIGIEIGFGPNLGLIISGRYHLISDAYFDLMAGLALHF
jgi:hypothetical protein